jgi:hypothetical protein
MHLIEFPKFNIYACRMQVWGNIRDHELRRLCTTFYLYSLRFLILPTGR